ncbi:MAG: response regulator [Deltaproteobacteria bacterium]|nr:response regulator [Deltaproteobacteria bacterium]
MIKETLKVVKDTIPSSIRMVHRIDKNTGWVMANPSQIHQVLLNLCVNAVHAMEKEGGELTVSLETQTIDPDSPSEVELPPGNYVKLTVSDTGQGIDPLIKDKIFSPYFTTKEKGKGTGLGLAVVHGIVKDHDGHIMVNSKPGQGTAFEVYFRESMTKDPENYYRDKMEAEQAVNGERVMIVEDDIKILNVMENLLIRNNYNVRPFLSSIEALETFTKAPDRIDLVLVDFDMPDKNGLSFAWEIKRLRPNLPVVLITGSDVSITSADLEQAGIKNILFKPVSSRELYQTSTNALAEQVVRSAG